MAIVKTDCYMLVVEPVAKRSRLVMEFDWRQAETFVAEDGKPR